jgi:hypothetical protein
MSFYPPIFSYPPMSSHHLSIEATGDQSSSCQNSSQDTLDSEDTPVSQDTRQDESQRVEPPAVPDITGETIDIPKRRRNLKRGLNLVTGTPTEGRGSKKRPLTSHIYLYGVKFQRDGQEWWRCSECQGPDPEVREYKISGCSTDKASQHLRKYHRIGKNGPIEAGTAGSVGENEQLGLDLRQFKSALCEWIACAHVSFSHVEHEKFRKFCSLLNPRADDLLPTHNTVHKWIDEVFFKQRTMVVARMKRSTFRINWSFDLWTSSNNRPILGIVAHWLESGGQSSETTDIIKHDTLLALKEIRGAHTGANIEATFWNVIQEAELEKKLGYFMLDNASSNTTALDCLENRLDESQREGASPGPGLFLANERRLHCIGHIFNLVARRILYGKGVSVDIGSEASDQQAEQRAIAEEQKRILAWRKMGPLGKLRNIVAYVRGSPQRIQRFLEIRQDKTTTVNDLLLVSENDTRWNSSYSMLSRALQLQTVVNYFVSTTSDLNEDALSTSDWFVLKEIHAVLAPFYHATLALEGRAAQGQHGTLCEVIPTLQGLKKKLLEDEKRCNTKAAEIPDVSNGHDIYRQWP